MGWKVLRSNFFKNPFVAVIRSGVGRDFKVTSVVRVVAKSSSFKATSPVYWENEMSKYEN